MCYESNERIDDLFLYVNGESKEELQQYNKTESDRP